MGLQLRDLARPASILLGPLDFRDRMVCDEQALRSSNAETCARASGTIVPTVGLWGKSRGKNHRLLCSMTGPDSCCRFLTWHHFCDARCATSR